jgi:hypothetical protein
MSIGTPIAMEWISMIEGCPICQKIPGLTGYYAFIKGWLPSRPFITLWLDGAMSVAVNWPDTP